MFYQKWDDKMFNKSTVFSTLKFQMYQKTNIASENTLLQILTIENVVLNFINVSFTFKFVISATIF